MKARRLTREGKVTGILHKKQGVKKEHLRFKLPAKIKSKVPEQMIKDGYGLREKSLWISDAIKQMLEDSFWMPMALEPINSISDLADDGFYVEGKVLRALDIAANDLVEYAEKDGRPITFSRTHIIRAAIIWRFIQAGV